MHVVAIIVSYKNENLVCHYVNEELRKCKDIDYVVIVNNEATEESNLNIQCGIFGSEIVRDGYEYKGAKVIILPNIENQGFARGNNQGARFAKKHLSPQYLLFTNDDIRIVDNDVIKKLIRKIDTDETIGAIGPKITWPNIDSTQGPIPYSSVWKRYFVPYAMPVPFSWYRKHMEVGYMENAKEGFHYVLVGCFFLMRANDFYDIGMMDEHTFLYREEEIISERLNDILNKRCYWLPSAHVVHDQSVTTGKYLKKWTGINPYIKQSDLYYYHVYRHYSIWQIRLAMYSGLLFKNIRSGFSGLLAGLKIKKTELL